MTAAMKTVAVLVLVGVGSAGCDEDLINPMAARQGRVNNYSGSDFYQDGMGMRPPPEGAVPRQRITGTSRGGPSPAV